MGAADFNTGMTLRGTREELLAMLKVLKSYATEKHDQYVKERNCAYLMSVFLARHQSAGLGQRIDMMTDEDMLDLIDECKNVIEVDASGPYGIFGFLSEVRLFLDLAEAAPHATFEGGMGGFNPGGDQVAAYELKDGLLYCKYAEGEDAEWDEEDEDWDDDDDEDWEDEEPDWTDEEIYDPVARKFIRK